METIIARDTDVLREYLAALDARERGLSPFAKLAATIKLARLRRELATAELEATDEDFTALRREIDERLDRSLPRRFQARPWGARVSVFLALVVGQLLALALIWLLTALFVRFAPVPKQWNPVLPHEQPPFLFAFIFLFFFATPALALLIAFGGRYFRAWRITLPATLAIFALSALATFLVVRDKEKNNPVRHVSSAGQLMKEREVSAASYDDWVSANWLMKDGKFKRDYESYLRNGPGRWITSRFNSADDSAWSGSLPIIGEYLDGGQDVNGFRDWLKYYLDRNRIYSEDRIDEEAAALTGQANQRYLGVWQVEPFLKERDERLYRAYLGSVDASMKRWGLAWLGLLAFAFVAAYAARPTFSVSRRLIGRRSRSEALEAHDWERSSAFPERLEITTPPFYETPFKVLSRVHRGFLRLVVLTVVFVFAFWAVIYALELSSDHPNPNSQVALMRGNLPFGGSAERPPTDAASLNRAGAATLREPERQSPSSGEGPLAARVRELEQTLDENDYQSDKKFKAQYRVIAAQRSELYALKSATGQLQGLPEQLTTIGSRVGAAEARAGEGFGQAEAARQAAEGVQKQLGSKLSEVETRATRASEQVGKVEDQASVLATRTEALEKELDRRARQIEARTEELGERTAGLKEREERIDRLQRIAFAAIFGELKSNVDDLDRRLASSFYRFLSKGEARRDADSLRQRITSLTNELRAMNTDQAKQFIEQLDELGKRMDQISERIK
ncbi:MAG TPA: hypothetical protein VGL29_06890 [Blastocatellia bacterium]|jgi:hypothetical protein